MKVATSLPAIVAAVALTSFSGAVLAADPCRNVTFAVINDHFSGEKIEIRRVVFRNAHNQGREQTEDINNFVCLHGQKCVTAGDNLKNANQVDLYDMQVVFRYEEHDNDWSDEFITQKSAPSIRKCWDSRNYGPIVVQDSP